MVNVLTKMREKISKGKTGVQKTIEILVKKERERFTGRQRKNELKREQFSRVGEQRALNR